MFFLEGRAGYQQIHDACQQVNNVVELLETAHPQWIQSQWQ